MHVFSFRKSKFWVKLYIKKKKTHTKQNNKQQHNFGGSDCKNCINRAFSSDRHHIRSPKIGVTYKKNGKVNHFPQVSEFLKAQ